MVSQSVISGVWGQGKQLLRNQMMCNVPSPPPYVLAFPPSNSSKPAWSISFKIFINTFPPPPPFFWLVRIKKIFTNGCVPIRWIPGPPHISCHIFCLKYYMHTSHVMFRLKPGFGCEIKSSSLSSQLSLFSSAATAVPPSGAGVSGQMAADWSICGRGGTSFPFTEQRQVSSASQLTSSWIPLRR